LLARGETQARGDGFVSVCPHAVPLLYLDWINADRQIISCCLLYLDLDESMQTNHR
jgi:hypothetical protein